MGTDGCAGMLGEADDDVEPAADEAEGDEDE